MKIGTILLAADEDIMRAIVYNSGLSVHIEHVEQWTRTPSCSTSNVVGLDALTLDTNARVGDHICHVATVFAFHQLL